MKFIITMALAISTNVFASNCYEFSATKDNSKLISWEFTSCDPRPNLYLVVRTMGSVATKSCDEGELLFDTRDVFESYGESNKSINSAYAYRFCVYGLQGQLRYTETKIVK